MPLSSPIIAKELRTLLRSGRSLAFLLITLAIISFQFLMMWRRIDVTQISDRAMWSRMLFSTTFAVQGILFSMVAPMLTAGAITGERERGTLDLLYCTNLSRLHILLGKWFSAIAFMLVLMLALLPIQMLGFMVGGIDPAEYLGGIVNIALSVSAYAMLGLAWSTRARKTLNAMIGSLLTIIFLHLATPIFHVTGIWLSASGIRNFASMIFGIPFYAIIFLISLWLAWRGLARGNTSRPIRNRRQIDSPELLRRRRRRFPYYLIDPLRRPHAIADNQNPVFIKEQRTGAYSRPTTLIRFCYLGIFLSVLFIGIPLSRGFQSPERILPLIAHIALGFSLLFLPAFAATPLSKEREEGTLAQLTSTMLLPEQIVMGKFRSALRPTLFLIAGSLFLPMGLLFILSGQPHMVLFGFIHAAILVAAMSSFYTAVGIYWSATSRRSASALVATYVTLMALTAGPLLLCIAFQTDPDDMTLMFLLSPLAPENSNDAVLYDFLRAVASALAAGALLVAAARIVDKLEN